MVMLGNKLSLYSNYLMDEIDCTLELDNEYAPFKHSSLFKIEYTEIHASLTKLSVIVLNRIKHFSIDYDHSYLVNAMIENLVWNSTTVYEDLNIEELSDIISAVTYEFLHTMLLNAVTMEEQDYIEEYIDTYNLNICENMIKENVINEFILLSMKIIKYPLKYLKTVPVTWNNDEYGKMYLNILVLGV